MTSLELRFKGEEKKEPWLISRHFNPLFQGQSVINWKKWMCDIGNTSLKAKLVEVT